MQLKKLAKNVVKAGVTMFAIGALLGIVIPAIAGFLGPDIIGQAAFEGLKETPILRTGIFFSAFGMVSAVVTPTVNYLFGERAEKTVTAKTLGIKSKELGYEQGVEPSAAIAHDPSSAISVASSSTHFQDLLVAQQDPTIGGGKTIV